MSAGPSRSRITRLELTADQLLGSDLTPARLPKPRKNAHKVITVEELLGPSLTIARPPSRPSSRALTRSPSSLAPRPTPRPVARPPSPRRIAVPNRDRVSADEVLRTGLPVRTLQAAKARARSGIVLTAEQLLASGSGSGSGRRRNTTGPRVVTAEELAGLGPEIVSSRRPTSAEGVNAPVSSCSDVRSGADSTRMQRPSTAAASVGGGRTAPGTPSGPSRGHAPHVGHIQRSSSQGSTRTLPMYTKEPGESEVVIDRGAEELEDEIPNTVMTPVAEDGPSFANGITDSPGSPSSPVSPLSAREADASDFSRQLSPLDAISPIPLPAIPMRTIILNAQEVPAPYTDEIPSYEAVVSMSGSPDLHAPIDVPLPASPALSPRSPTVSIPGRSGATSPSSPSSPGSPLGSSSPPTPSEGAESPRKRFPFITLFHSHSGSSRSRIRGGSVSVPSSSDAATSTSRDVSPSPPSPRPFHHSSQSPSGSMLDLLSRSWSENHSARSRPERGGV